MPILVVRANADAELSAFVIDDGELVLVFTSVLLLTLPLPVDLLPLLAFALLLGALVLLPGLFVPTFGFFGIDVMLTLFFVAVDVVDGGGSGGGGVDLAIV